MLGLYLWLGLGLWLWVRVWVRVDFRVGVRIKGNSTVTRVTFLSSCDTEFNILFTILLLSNPSCVCC